jgi:hypothetical protein
MFCWAALLVVLLGGTGTAVADHPAAGTGTPLVLDGDAPGPVLGILVSASSHPLTSIVLAIGLTIMAAGALRTPRRLAVILACALAVFACETALHSAHHVKDPTQAERCPVYSASLHVTGLEAGLATPELPLPMLAPPCLQACDTHRPTRVLDGSQARAPPGLPA